MNVSSFDNLPSLSVREAEQFKSFGMETSTSKCRRGDRKHIWRKEKKKKEANFFELFISSI